LKLFLRRNLQQVLQLADVDEEIDSRDFFQLGMDSLVLVDFQRGISESIGDEIKLPVTLMYDKPSIQELAEYLIENITIDAQVEITAEPIKKIQQPESTGSPLSSSQNRMWFMFEMNDQDPSYNISMSVHVKAKTDIKLLQAAFDALIKRHSILHTTYQYVDNQIMQFVQDPQSIPIIELDIRDKTPDQQQQLIEELNMPGEPFDLRNGPVIRAVVVWTSNDDEFILHVAVHHIASDGVSLQTMMDDLLFNYEQFLTGSTDERAQLQLEYTDFVDWLDKERKSDEYQSALNYWREQLKDAPRVLQLPTDHPRSQTDSFKAALYNFNVNKEMTNRVKEFAKDHQTTPFSVLITTFAIVLHKYSRDEQLNIGIPFSRRPLSETKDMVGYFTNTLVLKQLFSDDDTFVDKIASVTQLVREMFVNQAAPFEEIIDQLKVERNLSIHPLFQVNFNLLTGVYKQWKTEHLTADVINANSGYPEFDLSLEMFESTDGYRSGVKYNAKLFTKETIVRFIAHYNALLEQILADPSRIINERSLLTPDEKQLILVDWNSTAKDYELTKTVNQLFEEQVKINPDKIAVIFDDVELTYHQLNEVANRLAHYLLTQKVQLGQLIGVCLPRSHEMLIAVLAVLKAGCTYIPLDPAFPVQRLEYMVENSELELLITTAELEKMFSKFTGKSITLDNDNAFLQDYSLDDTDVVVDPKQLAYIIFTSGSTGNPKGVQIEHHSLTNFLLSMQEGPGMTEQDTLLAVTTLSFDIAMLELFLPLITGAKVVIAPEEAKQDVFLLQTLIEKHAVSLMQATPTTWLMLFESGWQGKSDLTVLCGGEALKLDLASKLTKKIKSLWNMYGPTETTIWSSVEEIPVNCAMITIGKPIANTSFYILDDNLHQVPVGLMGKLFIGGEGVSRGYLKRDDLTAEKFIPNPFSDNKEDIIYDTGDLARFLPDGRVECLGRADYQVKVRGFRLELGDIEAHLVQLDEVQDAVVVLSDDRLVAYVIASHTISQDDLNHQLKFAEFLRDKLKAELPSYMIPAAYVTMESFPLTPNKKIDRKLLPKPENILTGEQYIAPRDETEQQLATIWEMLLGHHPISVTADYFDCGGNSLLSISLITKINKAFNLDLPLAMIFNSPTIQAMAQYINASEPSDLQSLVVFRQQNAKTPIVLVHPIGGNIACYNNLIKRLDTDDALYGLQHPGVYSETRKHANVAALAEYYASEVHELNVDAQVYLIGWSFGGIIAYEMARFFELWGYPVSKLCLVDTFTPALFKQHIYSESQAEHERLWYFVQDYIGLTTQAAISQDEFLKQLGDKTDISSAVKLIMQQQFPDVDFDSSQLVKAYEVFLDNLQLYWSYQPASTTTDTLLITSTQHANLPTRGWDEFCQAGLNVEQLNADHFNLLEAPVVDQLADLIKGNRSSD